MSLSCQNCPPSSLVAFGVRCRRECYRQHQLQCNSWRHWATLEKNPREGSWKSCSEVSSSRGSRTTSTDSVAEQTVYFQITIRAQCAGNIGHFRRTNSLHIIWKKKGDWLLNGHFCLFVIVLWVELIEAMASIDDQTCWLSNTVNILNLDLFRTEPVQPLCSVCLLVFNCLMFLLLVVVFPSSLQGICLLRLQSGHDSLEL